MGRCGRMRRMHVADFEAGAFAVQTAGPSADKRRWCVSSAALIWSMNCDSCERAKNRGSRSSGLRVDQLWA